MDKLQMAHEYARDLLRNTHANHGYISEAEIENISETAFALADAMQAEADKRLKPSNSRELEWQPDWSQAPDWAQWWTVDEKSGMWWSDKPTVRQYDCMWFCEEIYWECNKAPTFNYQGDWRKSLRKRPEGK